MLAVTTQLSAPTPLAGHSNKVDLDAFMPPGRGRDLLLNNCASCHSFVCAITGQRTIEHWRAVKREMRAEVSQLDDDDYEVLFAYLEENFNDQKPEPNLPPELRQLGCNYGTQ